MKHLLWILSVGLFLAGCSSSDVVVVYSPHGAEMLGDYETLFEAAHPDVDVQVLDMGSKDVYSRVRAEKNRPQCDVWWGAPSTMFMQAADEGLLAPYEPAWCTAVNPQFRDPEFRWHATFRSPLAILYNDRQYQAEDMPQTWDALLDDAWKGKISLRKPLESGTMRTFIGAMIDRAESDDAGIAWLNRFHQSTGNYLGNPALLFDHIKKNPENISVWLMPDIVMQAVRNGFPFGYHIPKGTPVLTDGIAIVAGAPHREWAEKFYDFVTTEEALVHQASAYAKLPARTDIDPAKLPPKLVAQKIEPANIDWPAFAAKEKDWCNRWKTEVYEAP
ncbi:MAG: extracellular solute-binding protein [Candidatus Hydrogenedentes bacterium]|nr:extracellular solute-binding protein [Candidatus Hydrogenedentota bacterium]